MKTIFKVILITLAVMNVSLADWEEISRKHFKERVHGVNSKKFVAREINNILGNQKEAFAIKTIQMEKAFVEVYYPENLDLSTVTEDMLTGVSYVPHAWVKRNRRGKVIEYGTSFLLPRDEVQNPKLIEHEVFYFKGKNARKAFIANW